MSVQSLPLCQPVVPAARCGSSALRCFTLEFVALFMLLLAVNFLLSPEDPGWFASNPTPFLLLPAFMGLRHGLSAGLGAGLGTALLLLGARLVLHDGMALAADGHVLVACPLFGALIGLGSGRLHGHRAGLEEESAHLQRANTRLQAERELLLLSRQDLKQRLAFYGAEAAALDEELQELMETSREFTPGDLLEALERITRVRRAALYKVSGDCRPLLTRVALLGDSSRFPELLEAGDHPIVAEALSRKSFLIQKSLREAAPSRSGGYLAAYPVDRIDGSVSCVLIVEDVSLTDFRVNTFDVMKSICDWMKFTMAEASCLEASPATLSQLDFFEAMEAAVEIHREQAVPSILVRLPYVDGEEIELTEPFRELLGRLPGETVLSNAFEEGRSFLLFLLPAIPEPAARDEIRDLFCTFAGELASDHENAPHFVMTAPRETPQQLWGKLVTVSENDVPSSRWQ